MRVIMYGTEICPDCVEAKTQLKNYESIQLEYRDITEKISILKEFLHYRDYESMFDDIKKDGKVGIPFFVLEDRTKTFDIFQYINIERSKSEPTVNACSIDGTGC